MPDFEIDNRIRRLLSQAKVNTPKPTSKRCIFFSLFIIFFALTATIILLFQTITINVKATVYCNVPDVHEVQTADYGISGDIQLVGCAHFRGRRIQPVQKPIESAI